MPDSHPAESTITPGDHTPEQPPRVRRRRRHLPTHPPLRWRVLISLVQIGVFALLVMTLPGVTVDETPLAFVLTGVWAILILGAPWLLERLGLPANVLVLGTTSLVLNGLVLGALSSFTPQFEVDTPEQAILGVIALTGVAMLIRAPLTVRLLRQIRVWAAQLFGFALLIAVLPGLQLEDGRWVLPVLLVWAALNLLVRPLLVRLTLPITVFSIGLFSLVLNGGILWLVSQVVTGFVVESLRAATIGGLVLTGGMMVVNSLLYDEAESYYRGVARRFKWVYRSVPETSEPGVFFLEIDGLAYPYLVRALREGYMPTLASWLEEGSYRLAKWHTELPAQTSAMQAGILYGNNHNIPAFRWYEKDQRRMMVSGYPFDAREIAQRLSNGRGLLHASGSSIGNIIHGDAPPSQSLLTLSNLIDRREGVKLRPADFNAFFLDPSSFSRALVLTLWEAIIEVRDALRQRIKDVRPRVFRGGHYPIVRALTCAALRDITVHFLISDMYRGVPVAYATFLGYDETAHYAGPGSPDAMRVLRHIDERIARLAQVARSAPRPYRFVILSDHGQSPGAPFRQRYGHTLTELVQSLAHGEAGGRRGPDRTEGQGQIGALLTEFFSAFRVVGRIGQFLLRRHMDAGVLNFDGEQDAPGEVVVCASGNLGLIYFPAHPGRMTREQIEQHYPDVIPGLVEHEGIGFVLVRSEADGPVVLGRSGAHFLATGRVEGDDPLADFGPYAADHLRRLDSFENVGDIVVNSIYDPTTGEVAPFEEFAGSHGGLGGAQNEAFLMFPRELSLNGRKLTSSRELHHVFRQWVNGAQETPRLPSALDTHPQSKQVSQP